MDKTKIEWAHATFNPWIGCSKISPGCANCYAETETFPRVQRAVGRELWGNAGERHITSESNWAQPLKWNREARQSGERRRVFCASLADWLEDRPELVAPRARLLKLIYDTPYLDWLLLSKRPGDWEHLVGEAFDYSHGEGWQSLWTQGEAPENVWVGTTVENQEQANKRIPELLKIPARVRFLSCEPLLGALDLKMWLRLSRFRENITRLMDEAGGADKVPAHLRWNGVEPPCLHWVLAGGESGHGARPMHISWPRQLRDQCVAAGVPFFFKQHGEWKDGGFTEKHTCALIHPNGQWTTYSHDPRMFDRFGGGHVTVRLGKKAAGRLLDGQEWNEYPNTKEVIASG